MANMTFKTNLLPDNTAGQRELGSSSARWNINCEYLHIFDGNNYYSTLQAPVSTYSDNSTIYTLPGTGGTLALTSDIVDSKVEQKPSTTDSWRKILLHNTTNTNYNDNVTNITNLVYASKEIAIQPSTGNLKTSGGISANNVTTNNIVIKNINMPQSYNSGSEVLSMLNIMSGTQLISSPTSGSSINYVSGAGYYNIYDPESTTLKNDPNYIVPTPLGNKVIKIWQDSATSTSVKFHVANNSLSFESEKTYLILAKILLLTTDYVEAKIDNTSKFSSPHFITGFYGTGDWAWYIYTIKCKTSISNSSTIHNCGFKLCSSNSSEAKNFYIGYYNAIDITNLSLFYINSTEASFPSTIYTTALKGRAQYIDVTDTTPASPSTYYINFTSGKTANTNYSIRASDTIKLVNGCLNTNKHIYLTGGSTGSVSNTSQILFGKYEGSIFTEYVALSSTSGGKLIINPDSSHTTGQIILSTTGASFFSKGITANDEFTANGQIIANNEIVSHKKITLPSTENPLDAMISLARNPSYMGINTLRFCKYGITENLSDNTVLQINADVNANPFSFGTTFKKGTIILNSSLYGTDFPDTSTNTPSEGTLFFLVI